MMLIKKHIPVFLLFLGISAAGLSQAHSEDTYALNDKVEAPDTVRALLEHASEELVETLATALETQACSAPDLAGCDGAWLDNTLGPIEDSKARAGIKYLAQALAIDEPAQKEELFRKAILTGFSHPLPFLYMIDHLVSQQRYTEAHYIFEMYRLAVMFNAHWSNLWGNTRSLVYQRQEELYRLEGLFETALDSMREHVYSLSTRLPALDVLLESLEAWPESSRNQAEDMLFEKTFHTPWDIKDFINPISEAFITRSRQRWLESGTMEEQIILVQGYLRRVWAPQFLPVLHEQLALMLTDLGRQREAADLLYGYVSSYKEAGDKDYYLSLSLVALTHELNLLGVTVPVPSYGDALERVKNIQAAARGEALIEKLTEFRNKAHTVEADAHHLYQLYQGIHTELTEFNPGGAMRGTFDRMLITGLTAAKKQKLYSGPVPDFSFTSKLYYELDRNHGRLLQLFTPTFNYGDIEEMTGLYLESLGAINDEPLPKEAIALQWLANSKWLTARDPSLPSLNSLQEALDLVDRATRNSVEIVAPMKIMRDLKWPNRTPEAAKEAKRYYLGVFSQVGKL